MEEIFDLLLLAVRGIVRVLHADSLVRNFDRTAFVEKLWGLVSAASGVEASVDYPVLGVATWTLGLTLTRLV